MGKKQRIIDQQQQEIARLDRELADALNRLNEAVDRPPVTITARHGFAPLAWFDDEPYASDPAQR